MKFYGGRRKPTHLQNDGRLTGKQRGAIGIAVSLLVLAGTLFAIYRAAVRPPERSVPAQTGLKEESSPAERVQASAPEAEEAAALPAQTPVSHRRGVYNILLCGTDGDGLRTDTIMLGHLDERSGAAALLSIPRDTPLLTEDGRLQKLNAVYAGGGHAGMRRLKKEVGRLLGFEPDGYVLIDLDAFRRTVDLLGGVWFDVPQDMDYSDPAQALEIHLKAGKQWLNGEEAMQLVRYRSGYATQDIRRTEVQQRLLRQLARQCLSAENLPKLLPVVRVFYEETLSDLTTGNLIYLAAKLCRCDLGSLTCCTLQGEGVTVGGVSYYPLYAGKLLETVNRSFNPYDVPVTEDRVSVVTPEAARAKENTRTKTQPPPAETEPETHTEQKNIPLPNDPVLWAG